jgi:hypothetical protein
MTAGVSITPLSPSFTVFAFFPLLAFYSALSELAVSLYKPCLAELSRKHQQFKCISSISTYSSMSVINSFLGLWSFCLFLCCCLFVCFVFWDRVCLYNPGCPGTHFVDQAGLELRNLAASASQVLRLKVCTTTPGLGLWSLEWLLTSF